jgi:hypothetical protein
MFALLYSSVFMLIFQALFGAMHITAAVHALGY